MKIVYNSPNLKDMTIEDDDGVAIYTLTAADREQLEGGDAKIDADSNGNVTVTSTGTNPATLFSTVPVTKNGTDPVDNAADLMAALQNPAISSVIMAGNINLTGNVTVVGYKLVMGYGTITPNASNAFTIGPDASLILDPNITLAIQSGDTGNNQGVLDLKSGATFTDANAADKGWAFSNGGGGSIIAEKGSTVTLAAGFDTSAFTMDDNSYIVIGSAETLIVGNVTLSGNFAIGSGVGVLGVEKSGVLTIAAGITLTVGAGTALDVNNGFVTGVDNTSLITLEETGGIAGTRAGLVAGAAGAETTYEYDSSQSVWTVSV
jgi:hypothetical protein